MTLLTRLGDTDDVSLEAAGDASLGPRCCDWCGGVVASWARRDARFCGVRCRQASHRLVTKRADIAPVDMAAVEVAWRCRCDRPCVLAGGDGDRCLKCGRSPAIADATPRDLRMVR